ncbi:MAG: hypothetical protein ABJB05_00405 [Parafilimonas sp.]
MVLKIFLISICTFFLLNNSFAQTKISSQQLSKVQTWQLLNYEQYPVYGTSVNRAYKELLKGKKRQQVIISVLLNLITEIFTIKVIWPIHIQ